MADNTSAPESAAEYWQNVVAAQGLESAVSICRERLNTALKQDLTKGEKEFCRELFGQAYQGLAERCDPAKLVYPFDFQEANKRGDVRVYHENARQNGECARSMDAVINGSCYATNHYNLDIAAMRAILDHGFQRVGMILAHVIQRHEYDDRYSLANKAWAKGFDIADEAFASAYLNAHPILIEDFTKYVRANHAELNAERFALPGHIEHGEINARREITRAITFNDRCGYAIAQSADHSSEFVTWQFRIRDDSRSYNWGHYFDDQNAAENDFRARVIIHMTDGVREIPNPLANLEAVNEQNYDMIDGINNNAPPAPATESETEVSYPTVTREEMNAYGYLWDGMEPLSREAALAAFDGNASVLLLYPDNTESYAETREAIIEFDGLFGREIEDYKEPTIGDYVRTSKGAPIQGVGQITGYANDDFDNADSLNYFIVDFGMAVGTCTVYIDDIISKATKEEYEAAIAEYAAETASETSLDSTPETTASGIAYFLAKWQEKSDLVDAPWREDIRYREHKGGALFYKGGEEGQYLRVSNSGTITIGRYELAKPGIEDAVLVADTSHHLPGYDQALMLAARLGGESFIADLFGEAERLSAQVAERRQTMTTPDISVGVDKAAKPEAERKDGYTSVLSAIEKSKTTPKPARKAKAQTKTKQKGGEEL